MAGFLLETVRHTECVRARWRVREKARETEIKREERNARGSRYVHKSMGKR